MPCVSADGTLTDAARAILMAIRTPASHEDAARAAQLPLFRVRASIREMKTAGMISERDDGLLYVTDKGIEVLNLG